MLINYNILILKHYHVKKNTSFSIRLVLPKDTVVPLFEKRRLLHTEVPGIPKKLNATGKRSGYWFLFSNYHFYGSSDGSIVGTSNSSTLGIHPPCLLWYSLFFPSRKTKFRLGNVIMK